jgi:L-lactate dehydrogenase
VPFANPLKIRSGRYEDLKNSRLVIISAGVSQKPGESRLDLLRRNAAVFREVVPGILKHVEEPILIVATNPLDIMTYLAEKYALEFGLSGARVLGSGTMLDTARFRTLLGEHVGVDPQHVHGYVIGEHGDSEVLAWSTVTVAGLSLEEFCSWRKIDLEETVLERVDQRVRNAAKVIIEGKGATYYGVGSALAKLADVILNDQRAILTVSTPSEEDAGIPHVSISLPRVVGGEGILYNLPLSLNEKENTALQASAEVVRKAIDELDLA